MTGLGQAWRQKGISCSTYTQNWACPLKPIRQGRLKKVMRILLASALVFGASFMACAESTWSVARASVQGRAIVYRYIDPAPPVSIRQKLPWLTIISWRYDGSENDGMPPAETNKAMIELEDALLEIVDRNPLYLDVYSATGNDLKKFAFYIADREAFMADVNNALRNYPVHPVEIKFYEDSQWSDLATLQQKLGVGR